MSTHSSNRNSLGTVVKKFFLSTFVVVTFLAYILHERFAGASQANTDTNAGATIPTNGAETAAKTQADEGAPIDHNFTPPTAVDGSSVSASVIVADTPTPAPSATSSGRYKDGTYTGSEADAYYGLVQVQAVVQNGQITDVSFLEYPNHRRTSVEINDQAMPWLQQEAIQAQSAQVDLISGATLTSQAFVESLQAALNSARN